LVSGKGVAPFSYRWSSDPEQTTQTATGLANGTYTVIVTDANGCFDTLGVTLGVLTVLNDGINNDSVLFTSYPNPTDGYIHVMTEGDFKNIRIDIIDIQGSLIKRLDVKNGSQRIDVSNLAKGLYYMRAEFNGTIQLEKLMIK